MNRTHLFAGAVALAITLAGSVTAYAAAMPYRFERVNDALHVGPKDIVQVRRLVHGMENMPVPVKAVSAKDGICSFAIQAAVPGRWQLHLGAGVQGEPAPVRGTIDLDLVQ